MNHFELRELDFISAKLRLLIEEASKVNKRKGVLINYEQFSLILDHDILTESLLSELCCRLIKHDIIIVNLGAHFLVLEGEEVIKYKKSSVVMFKNVMNNSIIIC